MASREILANVHAQVIIETAIEDLNEYCNELARDGQGFNPDLTAAYHCLVDTQRYIQGKKLFTCGLNSGRLQR